MCINQLINWFLFRNILSRPIRTLSLNLYSLYLILCILIQDTMMKILKNHQPISAGTESGANGNGGRGRNPRTFGGPTMKPTNRGPEPPV